jgi:hypothetical protein
MYGVEVIAMKCQCYQDLGVEMEKVAAINDSNEVVGEVLWCPKCGRVCVQKWSAVSGRTEEWKVARDSSIITSSPWHD